MLLRMAYGLATNCRVATRRTLFGLTIVLVAIPALGHDDAVVLSVKDAIPAPSDVGDRYGPEWSGPLGPYVQLCLVKAPKTGKTALTVLIVRLDLATKDGLLDEYPNLTVPNPLILNLKGHKIGELPEGFPVDPPGKLIVTFRGWHENFPTVVTFYQQGTSAIGPHALRMHLVYDEKERRFVEQARAASSYIPGRVEIPVSINPRLIPILDFAR